MMMTRSFAPQGRGTGAGERVDAGGGGGRKKRPRRRPAAPVEQGEDPVDRPVEAGVFAQLDDMLARHRARRAPTAHHARLGVDKYAGLRQRWPGRSPIPRAGTGTAGSRRCSRPAYRRRWSAGSWRRKGSWRTCPSDAGIVPTRRDDAGSRQSRRPGLHGRASEREVADGHQRDQGQGREGVPLADDRLLRWQDRRIHRRLQPQRGAGQPDAGESGLDAARERASLVHSDRGCHCRWPGWLGSWNASG